MAGTRQPTAVVVANGKKHLSAAEKAERLRQEVPLVPKAQKKKPVRICYPDRLPDEMRPAFRAYALQLIALGIYINASGSGDADALRDYMLFQHSYLNELALKNKAIQKVRAAKDEDDKAAAMEDVSAWGKLAQKDFAMAKAAAASIGLTVSARCKLVIPQAEDPDHDADFDSFFGGGNLEKLRAVR